MRTANDYEFMGAQCIRTLSYSHDHIRGAPVKLRNVCWNNQPPHFARRVYVWCARARTRSKRVSRMCVRVGGVCFRMCVRLIVKSILMNTKIIFTLAKRHIITFFCYMCMDIERRRFLLVLCCVVMCCARRHNNPNGFVFTGARTTQTSPSSASLSVLCVPVYVF